MINQKTRFKLYLSSITTILIVVGIIGASSLLKGKLFGTGGTNVSGLKMEIVLQQPPPVVQIEMKDDDDKKFPKEKAELSKKKEKKKEKKKKYKKKIVKKTKPQKQVIDKGRIGHATMQYAHKINGYIARHMFSPDYLDKSYKLQIRFRLNGNGEVVLLSIRRSSGNKKIDKLALRTIRQISPFPAPPPIVRKGDMTFVLPMEYLLD
ncbi:MAG: TonB family protein [Alphaproteobacteria bacterium]